MKQLSTLKKYYYLALEGKKFRDKFAIFSYLFFRPITFLFGKIIGKNIKTLLFDVTLKNTDGIFFCGDNMFTIWCGSSFHEPKLRKYFDLKEGVFIDVGANIGKFSVIVGKKLGDKGKIISLEPEIKNFNILKKNIQLNKLNNIYLINAAAFSRNTSLNLSIDPEGTGGHSFSIKKSKRYEKIKAIKLDSLISKYNLKKIDLIKIDVEGAEADVLAGANEILKRYHPKIIFEAWDKNHLNKVKEILKKFKYKVKKIDSEDYFAE